jgi:hypothetical protein
LTGLDLHVPNRPHPADRLHSYVPVLGSKIHLTKEGKNVLVLLHIMSSIGNCGQRVIALCNHLTPCSRTRRESTPQGGRQLDKQGVELPECSWPRCWHESAQNHDGYSCYSSRLRAPITRNRKPGARRLITRRIPLPGESQPRLLPHSTFSSRNVQRPKRHRRNSRKRKYAQMTWRGGFNVLT